MHKTVCIACSVFKPELTRLKEKGLIDFPVRYLNSALHMKPAVLHEHMSALVDKERNHGHEVLLIYGDCQPHIVDITSKKGVTRVSGIHCVEILVGKKMYKKLINDRVFCLLPEWADRWRELLFKLLDADPVTTVDIMKEIHRKLVYLDTGVYPIPHEKLKACSQHFKLPYEVLRGNLDHLDKIIQVAKNKLNNPVNP